MSKHNQKQKQPLPKEQKQDQEGLAQGADAADASSLKKEIDYEGQTPHQEKKAS